MNTKQYIAQDLGHEPEVQTHQYDERLVCTGDLLTGKAQEIYYYLVQYSPIYQDWLYKKWQALAREAPMLEEQEKQ